MLADVAVLQGDKGEVLEMWAMWIAE